MKRFLSVMGAVVFACGAFYVAAIAIDTLVIVKDRFRAPYVEKRGSSTAEGTTLIQGYSESQQ